MPTDLSKLKTLFECIKRFQESDIITADKYIHLTWSRDFKNRRARRGLVFLIGLGPSLTDWTRLPLPPE